MHSPPTGVTAWSSDSLYYHLSKKKMRSTEREREREGERKAKPICKENDMLYLEAIIHNNNMNKI
jgi:hypothetical protein